MPTYTHEQIFSQIQFSAEDIAYIMHCRGKHNRLGLTYQFYFVRLLNRFPAQEPLEIEENILAYSSTQSDIAIEYIELYGKRRKTVSEHQESIRLYLKLHSFSTATVAIEEFLLNEAYHLEQTAALASRLREFLRTHRILEPAQDTMYRFIQAQREAARTEIYNKVARVLCDETKQYLDGLLETDEETYSPLHYLKKPPGNPSPPSFIKLTQILDKIKDTGILAVDMSWLNNNFQRSLARYARQCSTYC